jgi:hypothetical protein
MVEESAREMAADYGLPMGWLNSKAAAFLPEDAAWVAGTKGTSALIWLADLPTLAAMKLPQNGKKISRTLSKFKLPLITNPRCHRKQHSLLPLVGQNEVMNYENRSER